MENTPGLKEFDCKKEEHVMWLSTMTDVINKLMDPGKGGKAASAELGKLLAKNPLGVTIPPQAFINVHAGLSIKYAGNVLSGDAWLPTFNTN